MNKTTEALKLAEEALASIAFEKPSPVTVEALADIAFKALRVIREALADHSGDANEMVVEPYACEVGECPDKSLCAGACECLFKAEPVKQEPVVGGYKLLKDSTIEERSWPEDSAGENGNYFNSCAYCQRQFVGHKRRVTCKMCSNAAPVSAKREWVDLTDGEIGAVMDFGYATDSELENARDVIAAFKEKNK